MLNVIKAYIQQAIREEWPTVHNEDSEYVDDGELYVGRKVDVTPTVFNSTVDNDLDVEVNQVFTITVSEKANNDINIYGDLQLFMSSIMLMLARNDALDVQTEPTIIHPDGKTETLNRDDYSFVIETVGDGEALDTQDGILYFVFNITVRIIMGESVWIPRQYTDQATGEIRFRPIPVQYRFGGPTLLAPLKEIYASINDDPPEKVAP